MTNEVFWDKYIESMSLWRHRVFCVVYIIAYPLLVFTSNYIDTANFKTVLGLRLLCSAILSILLLFHFLNKIDGRKVSFATNLIIIVFTLFSSLLISKARMPYSI